jgi:hypothetical protein
MIVSHQLIPSYSGCASSIILESAENALDRRCDVLLSRSDLSCGDVAAKLSNRKDQTQVLALSSSKSTVQLLSDC